MPLFGPPNIEKLARKRDLEGLIKALDYEKDPAIPIAAAEALGRICQKGDTFPIRRLANQIHSQDPNLRRAALLAVGQIGDSEATGDVVMALNQEADSRVWPAAVWALAQINDEKAQKALDALFTANQPTRHRAAVKALDEFGWQPGQDRLSAWYWLTKQDLDALQALGPLAMGPLAARLHNRDHNVCADAADIMALLGEPAMAPLIRALDSQDAFVRLQAARALGEVGNPHAIVPLLNILGDADSAVRTAALRALICFDDPDILPKIAERMIDDEALWKAGQAYLDQLREPLIEKALLRQLHPSDQTKAAGRQILVRLGPAAVAPLVKALKTNKNPNVMAGIARALAEIGDPQAAPGLITALEEAQITNEQGLPLIRALAALGDTSAISALSRFLNASLPAVQQAAVQALGKIGAARAAQPLINLLSELEVESKIHLTILEALGKVGTAKAIPAVKPYLQAKRADIRQQAAQTLKQLGWAPKPAVPEESAAIQDETSSNEAPISTSAEKLTPPDSEAQKEAVEMIRALEEKKVTNKRALPLIESLGKLGEVSAIPALARFLASSLPAVQRATVQAMGQIGAPLAVQPLVNFLAALHGESKMHLTVLQALGQIGAPEAIPAIEPYLQAKRADIRQEAARVLGVLGWTAQSAEASPLSTASAIDWLGVSVKRKQAIEFLKVQGGEAVPELIDAAESSFRELDVREICLRILGESGDRRALEALGICFTTNRQYPLRRAALDGLIKLDHPAAFDWLAKDIDAVIKTGGMETLQTMGDKAVKLLGIWLTTAPNNTDRLAACKMLVTLNNPAAGPWLAACLQKETSQRVRMAALQAAGELDTGEVIQPLRTWLMEKMDYKKRIRICKAIGKINHPDSGSLLVHILKEDSSSNVRYAAMQALGELGDSQTFEFLFDPLQNGESLRERKTAAEALIALYQKASGALTTHQRQLFLQQKSWIEQAHQDRTPAHFDKTSYSGACGGPTLTSHTDYGGSHEDTGIGLDFPL